MTRRLYPLEALTLLGEAWNAGPDSYGSGIVDATIAPLSVDQARADIDSYLAGIEDEIDPDSIQIIADRLDDSDMDAARIIIKTEV